MITLRIVVPWIGMVAASWSGFGSGAGPLGDYTRESPAQREQRMAWFNEARFGMFIHWGLYAIPAGEWRGTNVPGIGEWIMEHAKIPPSEYEALARQFNPVRFNAREWVRIARDAGMKYIVITSKHHDGFGLWRSDLTDWCIKSTPFPRDPLKELADACRKAGLCLCFYYSIMDWHHPDWGTRRPWYDLPAGEPNMDRYVEYMKGQLKELITRYGPLGILWFDGEWEKAWTHERGADLYNYVRSLQPDIIINNRVGKGRAGMSGMDKGKGVGDYGTPEQEIPPTGFGPGVYWESCMTMNDTWGYRKDDHNWKSTQTLIRNLVDCASKGGNYLLNVGPTAEGLIPEPSVERLKQIGAWMKVNGEAIYGTTASPFKRLPWGRCTKKVQDNATTLYFHVFNWPADGRLVVPGLKNPIQKAWLLSDKKRAPLATAAEPRGQTLSVPAQAPDPIASVVVAQIKGTPDVAPLPILQEADGSVRLDAAEANLHGAVQYEAERRKRSIGFWTNPEDQVDWDIRLAKGGRFAVTLETATPDDGAALIVSVGNAQVRATVPKTGDYTKYQRTDAGTLELPAGDLRLVVRPVKQGWKPVNLRSVGLKPAQ